MWDFKKSFFTAENEKDAERIQIFFVHGLAQIFTNNARIMYIKEVIRETLKFICENEIQKKGKRF